MNSAAQSRKHHLQALRRKLERSWELTTLRSESPRRVARYRRLYDWQVERLIRSYSDLREQPRYRPATEFFISDLYGPHDVSRRDQDLARALPKLIRMLPDQVINTLSLALDLHVITQELDVAMIEVLGEALDEPGELTSVVYAEGYRRCDNLAARSRQITLLVGLGRELDRVVKLPLVYPLLKITREPARLTGFGDLQSFLERGFVAFRKMHGAGDFLRTIELRETRILEQICAGDSVLLRSHTS